ncbi:hypothetical protein [Beihai hermit crab virus 4]|uniref:Uncharacterized protein n=1 Tax=Beihai hermit crab virus 4 TaxID=1922391 RepID=A0A1L3KIU9_9NIDO|nr:hypothetical protein [Beihai hermit crab virus 4]APG77313.1 hypothetical protein [Beihai hermit crab virus 4]
MNRGYMNYGGRGGGYRGPPRGGFRGPPRGRRPQGGGRVFYNSNRIQNGPPRRNNNFNRKGGAQTSPDLVGAMISSKNNVQIPVAQNVAIKSGNITILGKTIKDIVEHKPSHTPAMLVKDDKGTEFHITPIGTIVEKPAVPSTAHEFLAMGATYEICKGAAKAVTDGKGTLEYPKPGDFKQKSLELTPKAKTQYVQKAIKSARKRS